MLCNLFNFFSQSDPLVHGEQANRMLNLEIRKVKLLEKYLAVGAFSFFFSTENPNMRVIVENLLDVHDFFLINLFRFLI